MWLADGMVQRRGAGGAEGAPRRAARPPLVVLATIVVLVAAGCTEEEPAVPAATATDQSGRTTVITPPSATTADDPPGEDGGEDPPGGGDGDPPEGTSAEPAPTRAVSLGSSTGWEVVLQEVPEDWEVLDLGLAAPPPDGAVEGAAPVMYCLVPPSGLPAIEGCPGVLVEGGGDWWPAYAGQPWEPGMPHGWLGASQVPACPTALLGEEAEAADAPGGPDAAAATQDGDIDLLDLTGSGEPLTQAATTVAGQETTYLTWRVDCTQTPLTLTVQQWWFPGLALQVTDPYGLPQTLPVLQSLRGGPGAAGPDATTATEVPGTTQGDR